MSAFLYSQNFEDAMNTLQNHPNCDAHTKQTIISITAECKRTEVVSANRASICGYHYKEIVNNGVFVKHDWW